MAEQDIALSQADLAALVELAQDTSLTSLLGRSLDKAVALTASRHELPPAVQCGA